MTQQYAEAPIGHQQPQQMAPPPRGPIQDHMEDYRSRSSVTTNRGSSSRWTILLLIVAIILAVGVLTLMFSDRYERKAWPFGSATSYAEKNVGPQERIVNKETGEWVVVGGKMPTGPAPSGKRLVEGKMGDPGCFKLPNGNMRCPNRWE